MVSPAVIAGAFGLGKEILARIFPDPAERAKAEVALKEAEARGDLQQLDAALAQEQERTKRHDADMKSDNWLSKNIRPGSLVYLLVVLTVLSITDGNIQWTFEDGAVWKFTINSEYIQLYKALLVMAFGFYFTSRGVEKVADIIRSWKAK